MFVLVAAAIVLVTTVVFMTTDIYVNRAYLAKKDFCSAFKARLTGNCDMFNKYILKDTEGWKSKCAAEKSLTTEPFYGFRILNVTANGEDAFVQVELKRGVRKETYPVTYEMRLVDGVWKINQSANN